jgi:hypothetical protein
MHAICLTIFLFEKTICKKLTTPLIQVFGTFTQEEITNFGTENIIFPPSLVGDITMVSELVILLACDCIDA